MISNSGHHFRHHIQNGRQPRVEGGSGRNVQHLRTAFPTLRHVEDHRREGDVVAVHSDQGVSSGREAEDRPPLQDDKSLTSCPLSLSPAFLVSHWVSRTRFAVHCFIACFFPVPEGVRAFAGGARGSVEPQEGVSHLLPVSFDARLHSLQHGCWGELLDGNSDAAGPPHGVGLKPR